MSRRIPDQAASAAAPPNREWGCRSLAALSPGPSVAFPRAPRGDRCRWRNGCRAASPGRPHAGRGRRCTAATTPWQPSPWQPTAEASQRNRCRSSGPGRNRPPTHRQPIGRPAGGDSRRRAAPPGGRGPACRGGWRWPPRRAVGSRRRDGQAPARKASRSGISQKRAGHDRGHHQRHDTMTAPQTRPR